MSIGKDLDQETDTRAEGLKAQRGIEEEAQEGIETHAHQDTDKEMIPGQTRTGEEIEEIQETGTTIEDQEERTQERGMNPTTQEEATKSMTTREIAQDPTKGTTFQGQSAPEEGMITTQKETLDTLLLTTEDLNHVFLARTPQTDNHTMKEDPIKVQIKMDKSD